MTHEYKPKMVPSEIIRGPRKAPKDGRKPKGSELDLLQRIDELENRFITTFDWSLLPEIFRLGCKLQAIQDWPKRNT